MCFKQILMLFMCFSLKIEFLCVLTEHFFYIFFLCGKRAFLCGESAYPKVCTLSANTEYRQFANTK
jgi:hypothetical protein